MLLCISLQLASLQSSTLHIVLKLASSDLSRSPKVAGFYNFMQKASIGRDSISMELNPFQTVLTTHQSYWFWPLLFFFLYWVGHSWWTILGWCKSNRGFSLLHIAIWNTFLNKCGYVIHSINVHFLLYGFFFANDLFLAVYFIFILDYRNDIR